ncbi:MAG TPA: LuxR C-terminal-related transcriptional regulator [Solirubrobacter sp.]|nr:LuxR C-terminal-related transcriptional regulator [Solirubrobacter sp.]
MSVDVPSLVTQFVPPPPPFGLVDRPRLAARLQAGLDTPVTLVCGPAGSGKTALLSSALGPAPGRPVAWVSLEPENDDPARFWQALLTSLALAGAAPAGSALAALAAPVRDARATFMPLLVNALAELPDPVVVVLDDVHAIRSRACLNDLSFLVLHAPDTLRLVLGARSDPALPLHVLRVRGRLTEIRAAELSFTAAEAAELMANHGLSLSAELVAALWSRTEGWPAGLRLAALSLQGRDDQERFVREFAGDDRVVGDYLLAEVLDRQPPKLRAFLLRTSIVDRVSGDLADALTGQSTGSDVLAELERTNGFVLGLDSRGEWYRYHRLFAKLLRTRAARELGTRLPDVHARAARWYERRGMGLEALEHAVAAAEWDLAVEMVAAYWFDCFVRGDGGAIRRLVDALPADRLLADAELAAALACAEFEAGHGDAGEVHLEQALAVQAQVPAARRRSFLETLALARLYRARLAGDFGAALAVADELLEEAAGSGGAVDAAREALVHTTLGRTALWAHHLARARTELEAGVSHARAAGLDYLEVSAQSALGLLAVMEHGPLGAPSASAALELAEPRGWGTILETACAHAALALAAFYDLQPAAAEEHLARARVAVAHGRARHVQFMLGHLAARMAGARGQPAEGLRLLDAYAVTHRRGTPSPYEVAALASMRARLHAAAGDLAAAEATLDPVRDVPWLDVTVTAARLKLAAGEPDAALELIAQAGGEGVHVVAQVELVVLEAIARDSGGEPGRAAEALERALALAEQTGHRWTFLEGGRRMEALLRRQIRTGTAHRAIVGELLLAFEDRDDERRPVAPLLEPLSEREQAILRYLPTTLSNREIAAELFVTTNTVKTHLRSIYRKLDVARRREAVERARDLRLLSASGGRR